MKRKDEKIKLAVFDLDGTLLDSNDSLQKDTITALRMLYDSGVHVMLNSGRVPSMAEAYFYEAGIKGIRSCANGASIVGGDGIPLYQNAIGKDTVAGLVERFTARELSFSLMTERDVYIYGAEVRPWKRFSRYEELAKRYDLSFPRLLNHSEETDDGEMKVYKMPIMEAEDGALNGQLGFLEEFSDQIAVTRSGPGVIDIMAAGVSKGSAVRFVAEYLGIRKEEICCIGDYDNDVCMFDEAGIAVAMGNAPERVKAAADYVTKNHNNGGAAEAIMRYILPHVKGGFYENQMD